MKQPITIIVATDMDSAIGKMGKLPWHQPADLKRFRDFTLHNTVIMGRKTYDSIGKPLPSRVNIVVTSTPKKYRDQGIPAYSSLGAAIRRGHEEGKPIFIIGGATIYEQAISFADKIELTLVHTIVQDPDALFPSHLVDGGEWQMTGFSSSKKDEKNRYPMTYATFTRKRIYKTPEASVEDVEVDNPIKPQ